MNVGDLPRTGPGGGNRFVPTCTQTSTGRTPQSPLTGPAVTQRSNLARTVQYRAA